MTLGGVWPSASPAGARSFTMGNRGTSASVVAVSPPASVADPERYPLLRAKLISWFKTRGMGYLAEELADRTFEKCLRMERKGKQLRDGYVFAAARSVEIDERRARVGRVVPRQEERLLDRHTTTTRFDTPEAMELLASLTPIERRVVLLRAAGYRDRETGPRLAITRKSVSKRMMLLRKKLRTRRDV